MKESVNKSLVYLITAAAVLSAALFSALLYFVTSGKADQFQKAIEIAGGNLPPCQQPDENPCPVITCEPCPECEPCAIQTADTNTDNGDINEESDPEENTQQSVEESIDPVQEDVDYTYLKEPFYGVSLDEDEEPADLIHPNVEQYEYQLILNSAAEDMEEMFTAAENDGVFLYLISGYRNYEEQLSLWYTYEEMYGTDVANWMDADPETSEHRLGLAADFGDCDYPGTHLTVHFDMTPAYEWLSQHAFEYGWIERYPEGKEEITGIMYSPWAFRYVGRTAAEKIYESGKVLEEFVDNQ